MSWNFNDYGRDMSETVRNLFNYCSDEYHATETGCDAIVDEWKKNKGDNFDNRFKDIRGYNAEQHCIVLDSKLFRAFDPRAIKLFFDYLPIDCRQISRLDGRTTKEWKDLYFKYKYIKNALDELPAECVNYHGYANAVTMMSVAKKNYDIAYWMPKYTEESTQEYEKRQKVVAYLREKVQQFTDDEVAQFINDLYPIIKAVSGQKMSKMVRKWCTSIGMDKYEGYRFEAEYAKYADAINPLELDEVLILSWNLLDYLTMSFGNNWTSCHSIDKENIHGWTGSAAGYRGCYSSGTLSYALDNTSLIVYAIKKSDLEKGIPYWNLPKIHRQMFHVDANGGHTIIQGRLYPDDQSDCGNSTDSSAYQQYREIVQSIIAQAFNIPNLWNVKRGTDACGDFVYDSLGTHYRDYYHYSNCNVSYNTTFDDKIQLCIGRAPICPSCGCSHDEEVWCTCEDCRDDRIECEDCGCHYDREDMIAIDGYRYCRDCAMYCDYHQEWEHGDGDNFIHGYGHVCNCALDELLDYREVFQCEWSREFYAANRIVTWTNPITGEEHYFGSATKRDCWLDENFVEYVHPVTGEVMYFASESEMNEWVSENVDEDTSDDASNTDTDTVNDHVDALSEMLAFNF